MNKVRGTLVLIFLLIGIGLNAQTFNNPGGTQNTCSGTFFDSGGSTGNYPNSETQTTTFCSDNGGTIIINFTAFSLETNFDRLFIYDGATVASPALGDPLGNTGTNSPGTLTSTGTCLTFQFTSDGSVTEAGWSASITCTAAVTEYPNPGGVLNVCSGNFTDTGGTGGDYGSNENVTTTICSDNGDPVNVAFISFDTEAGFDELFVFNGATTGATPYPGSPFSGTASPGTIVSSGTCLTFQFISDGIIQGGGWTSSVSCGSTPIVVDNPGGTVVGCNGSFFDTGGSLGNYSSNENITTTICPSTVGECLSVNFTAFDLEAPFDDLTIYDGSSTAATNLGTFTGTLSPGNVVATTDCLTFVFASDGSVTRFGWEALLSCNTCGVTVCTGSTPACSPAIPDACTDACDLGILGVPAACPTGGSFSNTFCLNNVGATGEDPYSTLIGCEDGNNMASPSADVWYSFVATANVTTINIDGLINPSLGVYEGSTCTTMIGRGCDNGVGSLSLEINPSNPGVTYFLQMSGGDVTDVGDFELEIISTWDCTNCLNSSILTATPPPVNGQYQPGQVVEFCFTINSWNTTANNWVHTVIPLPAGGWVPGSLTPTTIPPSCDANGDWDWYNTITGTNGNAINPGTVGPGFSFDSSLGGPFDNNPGNNFGDQGNPGDCPFGVTWTYCWTLEVADIANIGDCLANNPEYDLKMTVETYGDGETGSWTVESCQDDPVTESFTTTACCPSPLSVVDATTCVGESTGAATATGQGTGPFNYEWVDDTNTTFQTTNGVAGSNQATGLAAGTYTVSVTDTDNACIRTTTIIITENTPPSVTINPTSANICLGESTTLTATGSSGSGSGYTYQWEQPDATTAPGAAITASQIGTYTVTVTDSGGCTSTEEAAVGTFPPFVVTVTIVETSGSANNDGTLCAGDFATLDAGTYASYVWSTAPTDTNQTISVDGPATYTVTVTDTNGCTGTGEATISNTVLPTPTITITETSGVLDDDGTLCQGDAATLDAGVFTAYSWSTGATTQTISTTTAGLVTVTVTDANNCQGVTTTTIVVEPVPTPTITVTETSGTTDDDGVICAGDIAVLDAGSFASYLWSDVGASTTQTIAVNAGGTYTVSVTDGNGCVGTAEYIITENALPTPTVATIETSGSANNDGILCAGDFATLDAGTFDTYLWSNIGEITQTISVDGPGTYTVTVTDANGCEATGEATISNTALPTPTITITETSGVLDDDGTLCQGDAATLDAGVFTAYSWSTGATTQTISTTTAGLVSVTVTDANNCQGVASFTIVVEPVPTPTITVTETSGTTDDDGVICAGDIAVLDAGSFASYLWSDVGASTTQTIAVNAGGTYTVSVTDGNGCVGTAEFIITENALPIPTVATIETSGSANNDGILCAGDFATLDAGTFDTYLWSNIGEITQTISVDGPGTYTVTVTDANGCEATGEATISNTALPTPTITITETSASLDDDGTICQGDAATLDAGVFTAYLWSTGATTQTISTTTAGLVSVTVTDANNCQGIASFTIVVEPVPTPTITVAETSGTTDNDGTICTGDIAVLDAGLFASYLWSDALASTTQAISVNAGGTYTVSVTDGNGCIGTAEFVITENALPSPNVAVTETSGSANDDGIICVGEFAMLDAGTFTSYLWSNIGEVTQTISVDGPGTYTVTVTDANGCEGTAEAVITTTPPPNPVIAVTETSGTLDDDGIICDGDDALLDAGIFTAYSWSTGAVTQTITVNTPGLYTVTVTDATNCQGTVSTTIVVEPVPTPVITSTETSGTTDDDGVICTGDAAVLDAGTFASYLWSDVLASTTQTITVTTGGDYTVSVTDGNGCIGTAVFTITENPLPAPAMTITETSGTANDDGILCMGDAAVLSPGTFDTYIWSDLMASTTPTLTVTAAGDYTVTITDANGCVGTASATIVVSPAAIPLITITETSGNNPDDGILCIGDDAVLDAGTFTAYTWSNGPITQMITVNTAGDYTVTVTDTNGCQGTAMVTITVNPLPTPVIMATETSGLVDDDGTICTGDVAVLDAGIYAGYLWSDGAASITQTITVSTGGDYTVTVTDGNGCQESATITVTENPVPTPTIAIIETSGSANDDGILCDGDAADLDAGTFDSYQWSDLAGSTSQILTVTAAGDYTVTVTDANGCEATAMVTITITPAAIPDITITETSGNNPDDGILCIGDDAVLDAGIFTAYLWSTGAITQTITVNAAGTYTVSVTDANGCQGTDDVIIIVNPLPTPVITATETSGLVDDDGTICTGDDAVLDAGIYATYLWSDIAATTTQTITVLAGGDYTVTVTDGNGCQESATITIIENPLPTPVIAIIETSGTANNDGILCDGDAADLDAGTFVSYLWSDLAGSTSQIITVTAAGDYTVSVTDANGCESTATVTISTTPAAIPDITITETSGNNPDDGILCIGDDAVLDAGIFTAYLWSTGAITQTITVNTAGTYTVTVTDANSCQGTDEVIIIVNPLPTPVVTATETSGTTDDDGIICTGDDAVLDAGIYASYFWSDDAASTTQTITVNVGDDYTVTVTDGNGCQESATITITENPLPTPTIDISETSGTVNDDGILCDGDAAVLDAGAFVSYLWSDLAGSITRTITITAAGNYTVTVTDTNGCEAESTVNIVVTPAAIPDIAIIENSGNNPDDGIICEGDDAVLDAGIFTSYAWSTGAITQTITVNTAGDYTVIVTDANGCQGTDVVTIIVNPLPVPTIGITETSGVANNDGIICTGATVSLGAGTFSSYLWSTGAITQNIDVTTGGVFDVTVTDGNGCEGIASVTIIENPLPSPVIATLETSGNTNNDGVICTGDDVILDPGTFDTYLWSDAGGSTTPTITVTATGDYTVTVTNANGCVGTGTVTVTTLPIPTPVITVAETSGNLDDDGILCEGDDAVLDAGTFTSYTWSTGAITQTITVTTAGDYTVTVTDFNGCNGIDMITIDVNPLPTPVIMVTETSGNTDDDGIICVGDPAVLDAGTYASYLWSDTAGSITQTITVTTGGSYTVTVVDGNGCQSSATMMIIENPLPTPTITVTETSGTTNDDGIICEGDNALLDAGNFVSYVWSTGAITQTITVTTSGDYTVIVTNANGCEGTSTVTINAIPLPTPVIATLETSGNLDNDGILCAGDAAILDPGVYTSYNWSTGVTTATITVMTAGDYTVTVTDAAGCQGTGTVTIDVNPLPTPVVTIDETSGIADDDGNICAGDMATLSVGLFSSYEWSTGAITQTIDVFDDLDYTVTVTNGDGCEASVVANIIVNPLPTPAIAVIETSGTTNNDGVLCEGDMATLNAGSFANYIWSTGAITQTIDVMTSGTYSVTVTDVNGCSGEDMVTITVAPLPTPVITINETSGTVDNDGTICQGDVAVLDPGVYDSYLWSNAAAATTPTLSVTTAGTYTVTVTDANGCENTASATISVDPLPTPVMVITETSGLTDDDGIICEGDDVTLGVGLFGSYLWSNGAVTQVITVTIAGDFTVTVTNGDGCNATATATVVVNPLPIPAIIVTDVSGNTNDDGIICEGDAATLDAGTFSLYQWSTGATTQTISVGTSGTYTVTATDANGCNATDAVTITVNPSPILTDPDIIVCSNEASAYNLTQHNLTIGVGTVTWYDENPATTGIAIADPTTVDLTTNPNLWAELVNGNNCSETIDVSLTLNTPPTANITGTLSYCAGESTTLSATQGLGLTYEWSDTPATTTFDLVVTAPDDYTVTITDGNNCTATATVTVIELPLPTATVAANNTDACEGDVVTFTITGTPSAQVTYTDGSIAPAPVFLSPATGTATITVVTDAADATVTLVSITDGNCSQALTDAATTPVSLLSDAGIDGGLTTCGNGDANTASDLTTGLGGTPEAGGAWTDDNGTGVDLTDPTNVDFNGVAAGDYEFTYTVTGTTPCPDASAIVTVTVTDAPTATVNGTTCTPDLLTYSADVTALVGTITTDFGTIVDNTGGSYTITDIPANTTVTITVTDGLGCETSVTAFDDCPCPVLNDPINDGDMSMCEGTAVPELSVTVDAGLSANWYDTAVTGGTLLASNSTTYTPTVVLLGDNFFYPEVIDPVSGCTGNRVEVILTLNTNPTADPASLTVCDDDTDGFALFTLIGADLTVLAGQTGMTVTYYALPGEATNGTNDLGNTYMNVLANTQTIHVRVEDANGCFATSTVDLIVNPLPPVTVELTETSGATNDDGEICEGDMANLNVSIAGLAYEWSEGAVTTQDIDVAPLVTTTYTVTVTGLNTCTTVVETTVIVHSLPTATISFIETSGTTDDDGVICEGDDVVLAVAEAGVNYLWSTGDLSQVITVTPLVTTDYTVTTTNVEGCTSADTVTVVVNPLPVPVITVTETSGLADDDGILCEGDAAVLDAGVFDSYLWSDAAASTTPTITVTTAGTYSVTTTDANGCVGTGEITITVNPLPDEMITITETSGTTDNDGILCDGDIATLDAGVFMGYIWSSGEITQTISVSTAGTYSVTCVGFNGCEASTSVDIFYNPLPIPVITVTDASGTTADDGILCEGDAAMLDAGIADDYLWSDGLGSTTQMITVTAAGTYTVTITDANGCEGTAEIDIIVNPLPTPTIIVTETSGTTDDDGILCEGDAAVLDAGVFDAYLWSDLAASTTQTITVTAAGTYDVTTTDANGCVGTASITIFVNPLPTEAITITETSGVADDDGIICEGDDAVLDAGPGFVSYLWSDASTSQTLTVNTGGTYTVICMNANGCEATASVDIISTPLPIPTMTVAETSGTTANDGILCIGDDATLDAGVFDAYLWSDLAASTTAMITVTDAGIYTVTVTDANGCQGTAEYEIFVNPLPTPTITVTDASGIAADDAIICEGDDATLDVGVFTSYQWSDGLGVTQTVVVTPLVTTTYTVTATDANGCEATTEATVIVNPLPSTTIAITDASGTALNDGILCEGDMATLTAEAGFTYIWSDLAQVTQSIDVTVSGPYTVTITDGNGCESIATTVIVANPLPTPTIAITETSGTTANDGVLCIGDDAILSAGAFSAYEWSIGSATTATVTVNAAGTYTVTVTDANGCVGTAETIITTNPLPATTIAISETSGHTNDDGLLCAGDVATLDAGIFDSYLWSLGNANTQTITVNVTGDYTVTITDANGCEATSTVFISINPIPVPAITGDFEFCEGTSTVLTATAGYVAYAWSPSGSSASLVVTQTGDYTVTVTDNNGCTGEATVTVTDVPNPEPFIVGDNVICAGATTTIDVGAGYAAYNWSEGTVTQTATVSAGVYTVTVTDNNGCFGIASFNVAEEPGVDIQIEEPDRLTCDVQTVTLDASATANAAIFEWTTTNGIIDSGASTATPTVSQPGVYTVTIFSSSEDGCPTSADVTVIANPFTITDIYVTIDSLVCYGDSSAIITIDSIEGGIEPFFYQMDTSAFTGQTIYPGLMAGEYVLTVMDAEGCEYSETVTVTQPPLVTLDLFPIDTTIHLGDSVQLEAFVNPLIELADTTWTQTNWLSCTDCLDPIAAPLQNTLYELIVVDTNGCEAIATSLVRVENQENIFIPNAFTPNNDGANDVFMIYGGVGVTRVKSFVIFDRWGEQMFSKTNFQPNNPEQGWDGRLNGKPMRPAVFVYSAEVEFDNGRIVIFKGDVTLVSSAK